MRIPDEQRAGHRKGDACIPYGPRGGDQQQQEPATTALSTIPQRQGDRGSDDDAPRLPVYVRFRDLVAAGIVGNWPTLLRMIAEEEFPPGIELSRNRRAWRLDAVESWLAARPTARTTRTAA